MTALATTAAPAPSAIEPPVRKRLDAREFGLHPDTGMDATAGFRALLHACRGQGPLTVVVAPGRYDLFAEGCEDRLYTLTNSHVCNPRRCAILLEDLHDLDLDLSEVQLLCHGRLQPITIDRCSGITIRGGTIDWAITRTAQATVVASTPTRIDLAIDPQRYPHRVRNGRLIFAAEGWSHRWENWLLEFDPRTGEIVPGSGDDSLGPNTMGMRDLRVESSSPGHVTLVGNFSRLPTPGNVMVLRCGLRDHAGVFVVDSHRVGFHGLHLHHTCGLGILCQYSEDLEFRGVAVVPSAGRIFSGHDDGIHIASCRGLVNIQHCRFAGLMDDPINVHGLALRITHRLDARTIRCRFMHFMSAGLPFARPGDRIVFLAQATLNPLGEARVASVKPWGESEVDLTFADRLPDDLALDDAVENLSATCSVTVRDNDFASCRARGLLVSTPGRVEITGNRFSSSGAAILIAGDATEWYESGAVRDVLIADNVFTAHCLSSPYQFCEAVITILPEVDQPDPERPFHRGIRIERNTFHLAERALVYARSVDGLTISENLLIADRSRPSTHPRRDLITLDACRRVRIAGNRGIADLPSRTVSHTAMAAWELRLEADQELVVSTTHEPAQASQHG